MRIQQSVHNKIKKGIGILLSSVLTFGMAAGIIPWGGIESTLYVQAAGNQPSVMSLNGFGVAKEGKPANVEVKTINLNAAVLRPDDTWSSGGNQVYFGTYSNSPVKYRVLSSPTTTQSTTNDSLLLDCNTILATKTFEEAMNDSFYADTMFSNMEMGAIEATTLKACQYSYTMEGVSLKCTDSEGSKHVFCLSIAEADTLYTDDTVRTKTGSDFWWLRSHCESGKSTYTGGVNWNGEVSAAKVTSEETYKGVSPALNVNLSSVLLASVSGSTAKSSALAPVDNSTETEWKLTLLDNNKTVSVTQGQNVERQGTTITVPYTYGGSDVSQISIMITDKAYRESNAQVLYYGKLQDVTTGSTTGTGTFTLPADLASKTCGTDYYAYIIAEDINVATTTDYASAPARITIPAAPALTSITRVDITGIDAPVAGQPLDTEADCQSAGVKNTLTVSWWRDHTTAKYGTSYMASVKLEAKDGYEFANVKDISATVNGVKAYSVDVLVGGTYRVTYIFPSTVKAKLKSITAPADITGIANGTSKDEIENKLPTTVIIETEDESITTATVNWDLNNCNYDPAKTEEQTVTISGTVTCPEKVDANGVELTTSITITVNVANVADTVAAPTASVPEGTYRENQTVILTSATEGATIYYTMGADLYSGKRYTEGILVKAEPGRTETTTIKAIAVKYGMQDSAIVTFTYTIDLTGGTSEEQAPAITSQPQNKAVKTGEQAVFTVGATGTNLTYQWQVDRNDGKGFVDIDGENSESYIIGVTDMACNGFRYQCVVSNSASSVTSNIATLTVTDELTPPSGITYTITATAGEHGSITPSGNVEVKDGESQSFDITADEGYEIEALLVDGKETTIAPRYTFDKVTSEHSITVTFKQKGSTSDPEKTDPNPAEKPKQEAEPAGNQAPQHEHNFRWVTVQTASAAQDGLEELRCDCGMVMESSVVPASRAYVNELCQNLAAAMGNGSVTFDSGRIYTISDYIIKRLRDRADVTTTITFEYNHSQYRMIIPAGVDYTELLEDQDYFYGYFYFAKKVGAKVENL